MGSEQIDDPEDIRRRQLTAVIDVSAVCLIWWVRDAIEHVDDRQDIEG